MKVFRGGRTSTRWNETDARAIKIKDWKPNKILKVDGTINTAGQRHTDLGVKIESKDIVALFKALVDHYQSVEKENAKLEKQFAVLEEGFSKLHTLVAHRHHKAPNQEQLIEAVKTVAHEYWLKAGSEKIVPKIGWIKWKDV